MGNSNITTSLYGGGGGVNANLNANYNNNINNIGTLIMNGSANINGNNINTSIGASNNLFNSLSSPNINSNQV
jgi:hypothetical protein